MNWKTNYWTLLFVLAAAVAAYLQFSKSATAKTDETVKPAMEKPTALPNEIDSITASKEMMAWDALRGEFIVAINNSQTLQGDAKYVAKGFQIPAVDMVDIIATITPNTKVMGMLAIKDTAITIIFQVLDQNQKLRYYDFTLPCPNYCNN